MAVPRESAAPFVPESRSLAVLREAAQVCRGCSLYKFATQAVFGEGQGDARVMVVGEQPGDAEARAAFFADLAAVGDAYRALTRAAS